jgi:hypothetical protein
VLVAAFALAAPSDVALLLYVLFIVAPALIGVGALLYIVSEIIHARS